MLPLPLLNNTYSKPKIEAEQASIFLWSRRTFHLFYPTFAAGGALLKSFQKHCCGDVGGFLVVGVL